MTRRTPIRGPVRTALRTRARALAAAALALLLAAGAALAAALPAAAAPRGPDLPPELLAAMERDLGLPPAQARARVAAETAAAATAERLRGRLGASFGGAWFDAAEGGLVVATTDPATAGAIGAAGARARVVPHGEGELAAVQSELDAAPAVPDAVTGWHVDPRTSAVVVTATDAAAAEAFVARAGAAGDPVRVEVVAERPRLFADLVGGAAITSAGGRCSIGFSARSASTSRTYVLTAGHCTEGTGTWSGAGGGAIGPAVATSFPGDDFGAIRVDSSAWTPTSRVAGTASVTGTTVAGTGASVCRSGSTTGYRCGTVQSFNQTVNYGGGDVVYGMTGTSACAEPGDSGGSFVSGRNAQGLTSGGTGTCSRSGITYFQPIGEVLTRYGLTLVAG